MDYDNLQCVLICRFFALYVCESS